MSDKDPYDEQERTSLTLQREGGHLSDFSHRAGKPPTIKDKDGLVTEPTPAQRERLVYMVDNALDTLEDGMAPGNKVSDRINSANSVLDRAGVSTKGALMQGGEQSVISADALVQVVGGLARMFGVKEHGEPTDVTGSAFNTASETIKHEHDHSLQPKAAYIDDEQAEQEEQSDEEESNEEQNSDVKMQSGLPDSLLRSYGVE